MTHLDQLTFDQTIRDSPLDSDPVRATVALASKTTSEWLISHLAVPPDEHSWPTSALSALPPGTAVKILYHQDDIDPALVANAHGIAPSALVRTTCSWLPVMAISDRKSAIIFASPNAHAPGLVYTKQAEAISVLTVLFDLTWNSATSLPPNLDQNPPDGHSELLDTERRLLNLLAAGVTDETAARHLGISLRTTRRHMATLMNRLAATSRFQAGAEAAKRGWLT